METSNKSNSRRNFLKGVVINEALLSAIPAGVLAGNNSTPGPVKKVKGLKLPLKIMKTKWSFTFPGFSKLSRSLIILTSLITLILFACSGKSNDSAKSEGSDESANTEASSESINPGAANILFIVGDENGTSEPGEGIGDVFTMAWLKKDLGYNLTLAVDDEPAEKLQEAAAKADVVIIAESVSSSKLLDKIKMVETPIINYEGHLQDDMGFTALEPAADPGEPGEFAYGVRDKETKIIIVDPDHPLAAGFTGDVQVYKEDKQVTWGIIAESAEVVAVLPGAETGAVIYVYRKGAELFDGTKAAGLRVGFFLEDDDETGTANFMTEEGLKLYDAAVKFALKAGE